MTRTALPNEPPLCNAEEALRLVERADALSARKQEGWDERPSYHIRRLGYAAILDAYLVAVEVATDTGDPRVLAAALDGAHRASRDELLATELTFGHAVKEIVPALDAITNRLRECAVSRSRSLRAMTAAALGPRALRSLAGGGNEVDAEAAGIVFKLAADKHADVRAAAREALGGRAPPAWASLFPCDPLGTRSAAEAARLRGPLDRAGEALERGVKRGTAELAAAIAELPDELALPFCDSWARTRYAFGAPGAAAVLDRWLRADVDGERLAAWISSDGDSVFAGHGAIGKALARLEPELATPRCLRLVGKLRALNRGTSVAYYAADQIVEMAWPASADRRPLLETALGVSIESAADVLEAPPEADAAVSGSLFEMAMAPGPGLEPLRDLLIGVWERGMPGRWKTAAHVAREALLEIVDVRLRACAERWLAEGDIERVGWALRYLTGVGHRPETDPPVDSILASAIADARLLPAVLHTHALLNRTLPRLRAAMVAGALPPPLAMAVARAAHGDGPLAAREWVVVRDLRAQLTGVSDLGFAAVLLPPSEEQTDDDRAFFAKVIDQHGGDDGVAVKATLYIEQNASSDLIAVTTVLLERCSDNMRSMVVHALAVCRGEAESIWKTDR